jgi:NAD/NADP transhydrogenase beta subunit
MALSKKQAQVCAMGSMILIMTMVVAFVSTIINFEFDGSFVFRFFRGWAVAFILAFPIALVLMPRLQNFFQSKIGTQYE